MSISSDFNSVEKNIILFSIKKIFSSEIKNKSTVDKVNFLKKHNIDWESFFKDSKLLICSSVLIQRMKLNDSCNDIIEDMINYLYDELNPRSKHNLIGSIEEYLIPGTGISILNNHNYLNELIGQELSGQIKKKPDIKNIEETLKILKNLKIYSKIEALFQHLKFLCLAENDYGLINSLTCPNLPGFAVISDNNPPILILEQLIHESTHINFDVNNIIKKRFYEFIKSIPPLFSPIVDKPRTFEKFMTGYFAYLNVFNLWSHISKIKSEHIKIKLFSNKEKIEINQIIEARLNTLKKKLSNCFLQVERCIPKSKKSEFYYCMNEMVLITEDFNKITSYSIRSSLNVKAKLDNNIEYAELLLAVNGKKISRISRKINDVKFLNDWAVKKNAACYFSTFSLDQTMDEGLNGFSNIEGNRISLDNSLNDSDVYFYCGLDVEEVINCVLRDEQAEAGAFFEIPKCCRTFFNNNWEDAVKDYQGDLAKLLLTKELNSKKEITFKKECNVFAMYFGNGPLWHFPCKFDCRKTIKIIAKRINDLKSINKNLYNLFSVGMNKDILWSSTLGIGQITKIKNKNISLNWYGENINYNSLIDGINEGLLNDKKSFTIENNNYKIIEWH